METLGQFSAEIDSRRGADDFGKALSFVILVIFGAAFCLISPPRRLDLRGGVETRLLALAPCALCRSFVEEHVKGSDLTVPDDDHIQSRVVWRFASRAGCRES